jgi:hypothetical protein
MKTPNKHIYFFTMYNSLILRKTLVFNGLYNWLILNELHLDPNIKVFNIYNSLIANKNFSK